MKVPGESGEPSAHADVSPLASIFHCPLTNRACPTGPPLELIDAHPSPQGVKLLGARPTLSGARLPYPF